MLCRRGGSSQLGACGEPVRAAFVGMRRVTWCWLRRVEEDGSLVSLGAVTHDDAADVLEVELVEVGVGEEVGHFAVSTYEGDAESDGHLVGWWVNGRLFGNSFFFLGA